MQITVLTDKSSWMNEYIEHFKSKLENLNHSVRVVSSAYNLEKGDIAFFLSCFELIKADKLKFNKNNIVVHASALPKGKGWSPMTWQILEGKNIVPLTLFEAVNAVDAGTIYLQSEISLDGTELIKEWQDLLAKKIIEICLEFVENYPEILKNGKQQTGKESFYNKRTPKDSELDINKTLKEQFNLLRVVDNENYPAYFEYNNQKYILKIEKQND